MKKKPIQVLILSLLVAASFSAYVYLNVAQMEYQGTPDEGAESTLFQELEDGQEKAILPDVRLLKKAAEVGKRILPSS